MKCHICGAAELTHGTRDLPYTYEGETLVIAAVQGDFCPACSEAILEAGESKRVFAAMLAFKNEVDTSLHDLD